MKLHWNILLALVLMTATSCSNDTVRRHIVIELSDTDLTLMLWGQEALSEIMAEPDLELESEISTAISYALESVFDYEFEALKNNLDTLIFASADLSQETWDTYVERRFEIARNNFLTLQEKRLNYSKLDILEAKMKALYLKLATHTSILENTMKRIETGEEFAQ
jgi:hypothetical protein